MPYQSTKCYGNDTGLSCCFRQWRATHSHCCLLHGYSIGVKLVFETETLDDRNWVFDFGGCKPIKDLLKFMFDHTVVVARDDPALDTFLQLYDQRIIDLRIINTVGCEGFAAYIHDAANAIVENTKERDVFHLQGIKGLSDVAHVGTYSVCHDSEPTDDYDMVAPSSTTHVKSVEVFEHGANSALSVL